MTSGVLRHVIESIAPASAAHAEGARRNVAGAGAPLLERLAAALGGAQHTARPRGARRTIVVCAGDHGAGDPGIDLGAAHPTVVAAHAIAGGTAALAHVARASRTPIVLVDAGVACPAALPAAAIRLGRGPSRDLLREPAMTVVDAALALEAGIALAVSLAEEGLDVLAAGAIGVGAELASAALLGAALGARLSPRVREGRSAPYSRAGVCAGEAIDKSGPTNVGSLLWADAGAHGAGLAGTGALERLAALGGPDTAVLAGLMLGAASMNVPIVLDGHATGAAALAAAAFAPAIAGSLIAAHAGAFIHPRILAHLGLRPLLEAGLGHGEGTGAAMVLPLIDQVAALASHG